MNNEHRVLFSLVLALGLVVGSVLYAQTAASEITFPVAELGGCENKEACFDYCERPENGRPCLEFAKKHGLLPVEEIRVAEKVLSVSGGPGGCNSKASCENYCNDVGHMDECLAFAEERGLMKGAELEEAKKVRAVIKSGTPLPGGCRSKNECGSYCQNPEHMDECLAFAEAAGFIPKEELEQARKFIPLMKRGQTPGQCKTKDECEAYCEADENFNECIDFAEKNGLIPEGERKNIEAFKRAGGKGPGGCVGRQCEAFCQNPANQEACVTWAKKNGLLKKEDIKRMQEGIQQLERVLSEAPPQVKGCLETVLGPGGLDKLRSGGFFGGEATRGKIEACFKDFRPTDFGGPPPGVMNVDNADDCAKYGGDWDGSRCDFGKSECSRQGGSWDGRTCQFPEEQLFPGIQCEFPPCGPQEGEGTLTPTGFVGPGECKTGDECRIYCEAHPQECIGFGPPGGGPAYQQNPPTADTDPSICQSQGGDWTGTYCDFGRREAEKQCVAGGGTWDGSSCKFPNPPPSSRRPSESFLGQILQAFGPLIGVR